MGSARKGGKREKRAQNKADNIMLSREGWSGCLGFPRRSTKPLLHAGSRPYVARASLLPPFPHFIINRTPAQQRHGAGHTLTCKQCLPIFIMVVKLTLASLQVEDPRSRPKRLRDVKKIHSREQKRTQDTF